MAFKIIYPQYFSTDPGKLLRVDGKEEIQAVIAKLRMNPVAFDYLDLDNATKIVENFENPTLEEDELFRPGDFTPRDKVLNQLNLYNYQLREMASDAQSHSQTLPAHPSKAKNRNKVSELVHKTQETDKKFFNASGE